MLFGYFVALYLFLLNPLILLFSFLFCVRVFFGVGEKGTRGNALGYYPCLAQKVNFHVHSNVCFIYLFHDFFNLRLELQQLLTKR